MITIIDYDAGNLKSVQNMLRSIGVDSKIASTAGDLQNAAKLILPGVGHFDFGMKNLTERGMIDVLNEKVLEQKIPILGICLGAQLLTRGSDEGKLPGLGWVAADTCCFDVARLDDSLRVPHMGWADTQFKSASPLFDGFDETPRFYYVHSYHIVCDDDSVELCHATHGYRFVAGVVHGNIAGVQFHPEKSHSFGKKLLASFAQVF